MPLLDARPHEFPARRRGRPGRRRLGGASSPWSPGPSPATRSARSSRESWNGGRRWSMAPLDRGATSRTSSAPAALACHDELRCVRPPEAPRLAPGSRLPWLSTTASLAASARQLETADFVGRRAALACPARWRGRLGRRRLGGASSPWSSGASPATRSARSSRESW